MPVPAAITLPRQELYDRVWAEPVQRVAAALGVSDVALAKACRRHQIPVPPRGYWRRKETGHKVRQTKLPALDEASKISTTVTFWPSAHKPTPAANEPTAPVHPLIAFECDPENTIVVPEEVRPTHRLIRATRAYWSALKQRDGSFENTSKMPRLDINVSGAAQPRALRLLHVLLENLDARQFSTAATAEGHTTATILGVTLRLALRERYKQVPHEPTPKEIADKKRYSWNTWPKFDTVPTGDLELRIENTWGTRRSWSDGKRQRLEQLLNDVIEGLVAAALLELDRQAERDRQRRAEEERQRRREQEKRLHLQEQARVRHLEALMASAEHHVRLRHFVQQLRSLVEERPELGGWLTWANEYAERHDPLERWRNPQPTLTLYHPVHSYEADPIVANGFRDQAWSSDGDEQAPSVFLADVPVTRDYTSACVTVRLPEAAVLPFEELPRPHPFRTFRVPSSVLNDFPRTTGGSA
jgi:hypothetical protein